MSESTATSLPVFVLGYVLDYACDTPAEALRLALVARPWHAAFVNEEPLWTRLGQRRWPRGGGTRPLPGAGGVPAGVAVPSLPGGFPGQRVLGEPPSDLPPPGVGAWAYGYGAARAKAQRAAALRPIPPHSLHEIEACGGALLAARGGAPLDGGAGDQPGAFSFAFRCPLFAESLPTVGQDDAGQPILHCDVCAQHVYTVGSAAQLAKRAAEGASCVAFKPTAVAVPVDSRIRVLVVDPSGDAAAPAAHRFVRAVRAAIAAPAPPCKASSDGPPPPPPPSMLLPPATYELVTPSLAPSLAFVVSRSGPFISGLPVTLEFCPVAVSPKRGCH